MTEETRAQAARMATDILVAAMHDKGLLNDLKEEVGIRLKDKAGPLLLFDKIYGHILATLSEPANK